MNFPSTLVSDSSILNIYILPECHVLVTLDSFYSFELSNVEYVAFFLQYNLKEISFRSSINTR